MMHGQCLRSGVTVHLVSVCSARGLLVRGPRLEREEPKGKEVQAWNKSEQAPHWIMTGATKNLHDRNNNNKEKNEQNNRMVNVEERPKVPLRSLLYRREEQQTHVTLRHAFLQERTRSDRQKRLSDAARDTLPN